MNLIKRTVFFVFIVFLTSIPLLFQSCSKNDNLEGLVVGNEEGEITLASAREWFDSNEANSRLSGESANTAYWEIAYERNLFPTKPIVVVPFVTDERTTVPSIKQLWIYVDREKKKNMKVVEYIYDAALDNKRNKNKSLSYNAEKFSGFMLVRNWGDNAFLTGFKLKDGKIISLIKDWRIASKNGKIAATQGIVCNQQVTCYSSTATVAGYPEATYTQVFDCAITTSCHFEQSFSLDSNGGGGSFSPGGGGGGFSGLVLEDPLLRTHKFITNKCDLLTLQDSPLHREIIGLKLSDGRILVLPVKGNTPEKSATSNFYNDPVTGKKSFEIFYENGKTSVEFYTYDANGNIISATAFDILEHIHTHPCSGSAENLASIYDKALATNIASGTFFIGPDVKTYILNCNGKIGYNSNGIFRNAFGEPVFTEPGNCY